MRVMFMVFFFLSLCVSVTPIYVSVVSHSEEPPTNPNYIENPPVFLENRSELLYFAQMLHRHGIKLNWQSEWNFTGAVALYDSGVGTCGLNIVRYMHDSLGFEIDPHAHETIYNYADVAYFIEQLGVSPSNTVGGFIAMPPESSVLEHFFEPIEADSFPGYLWQAEILWGSATLYHIHDESLWISGIWKPASAESFFVHRDDAPLPHIGGYTRNWDGLYDLLDKAEAGLLDSAKMYTATIFVGQGGLSHAFTDDFEARIIALSDYTESGKLIWVTLQEAVNIWRDEYDSVPNLFRFDTTTGIKNEKMRILFPTLEISASPNPFNSSCFISVETQNFSSPPSEIAIYDLQGNLIAIPHPAGAGFVPLDKGDSEIAKQSSRWFVWTPDKSLPSGIYIIRATIPKQKILIACTKRIVYLK